MLAEPLERRLLLAADMVVLHSADSDAAAMVSISQESLGEASSAGSGMVSDAGQQTDEGPGNQLKATISEGDAEPALAAKSNRGNGGKKGGGNSPAGSVSVSPRQSLHTTELGGTADFEVVLDLAPTEDVFIDIATTDATEGLLSTTAQGSTPAQGPGEAVRLTFTPADWDTPQTVTVTGVDDADTDGSVDFQALTSSAVSADPNYAGLDPPDVVLISNIDDESPAMFVSEFDFDYELRQRGGQTGYRGELIVQVLTAGNQAVSGAGIALSVYNNDVTNVNGDSNIRNFVGETNSEGVFAARWWPGPGSYIVEVTDVWDSRYGWNPAGDLELNFPDNDGDHHPELYLELAAARSGGTRVPSVLVTMSQPAAMISDGDAAATPTPAALQIHSVDDGNLPRQEAEVIHSTGEQRLPVDRSDLELDSQVLDLLAEDQLVSDLV